MGNAAPGGLEAYRPPAWCVFIADEYRGDIRHDLDGRLAWHRRPYQGQASVGCQQVSWTVSGTGCGPIQFRPKDTLDQVAEFIARWCDVERDAVELRPLLIDY